MKLIADLIKKYKRMFLLAVVFLTFEAVADLLQPALMAKIVDIGVKNNDTDIILRYSAIMLLIAVCGALSAVVRSIVASKTSQQMGKELRSDLYKKVQTLSFENIDRLQPASIITRITNDVTQIQNFINGCMRILVKAPITCIGAVTLVIIQSPKQAPVMGAILLISGILIYFNMRLGYPRFGFLQQKLDKLNNVSRQFLSSIRVVKAFGAEDDEEKKFSDAATELSAAGISSARVGAVFGPLINLTVNMGVIALLLLFDKGETQNIGKLMASVNYMTQVLFALGMVSNILNMSVRATASANRVKEIFDEEPAQKQPDNPFTGGYKGDIVFENLSFRYSGSQKSALENINIHIKKGETIGIIGSTGSGKTTLVNLIPRFYDSTEGKVLIDGVDVTQADINSLRKSVACVPQRSLLFSGTIKDNLKWGDINADDENIKKAAKVACADRFIESFPDGYETILGQGGVNLSGGQKQRISIARALIRKPNILILDDCTSALDATTEDIVLRGIKDVSADMTVLLISQRISTVMKAHRVLCLEDGCIKGFGSHEELMTSCETYKAIYRSQIGGAF